MQITWPSEQSRLDYLQALEATVWRPVTFEYVTSISGCSVCSLDPVTDTSTDSFCPVCSGIYWIKTTSGVDIKAHVTWAHSEGLAWYSAGQQFTGDCQIKVIYNAVVSGIILNSEGVIVDDRDMQITKVGLLGAPTINRITLSLKERDKES
jgi:hypothetical protein